MLCQFKEKLQGAMLYLPGNFTGSYFFVERIATVYISLFELLSRGRNSFIAVSCKWKLPWGILIQNKLANLGTHIIYYINLNSLSLNDRNQEPD